MTLQQYADELRAIRGKLKSMDKEINLIWSTGSDKFIEFTLTHKVLGLRNLAIIVAAMSKAEQDEFVNWCLLKTRTKNDILVKLMEY